MINKYHEDNKYFKRASMFIPAVIIDGRQSDTSLILTSLLSIIKQTVIPQKVTILFNAYTKVDFDTFEDLVNSKDGTKIIVSCEIDPSPSVRPYDLTVLRTMKLFRTVIGTHKKTKKRKKFPITHVLVLMAGHKILSNNFMERLRGDWIEGRHYDIMSFKMKTGKLKYKQKSHMFYLPSIRLLCQYDIWQPILERQKIFLEQVKDKDVNFYPIRNCPFAYLGND